MPAIWNSKTLSTGSMVDLSHSKMVMLRSDALRERREDEAARISTIDRLITRTIKKVKSLKLWKQQRPKRNSRSSRSKRRKSKSFGSRLLRMPSVSKSWPSIVNESLRKRRLRGSDRSLMRRRRERDELMSWSAKLETHTRLRLKPQERPNLSQSVSKPYMLKS